MAQTAQVVETQSAAAKREETHPATLREYIESLLVTVILALFGTTFVVQAFKIPSQSMEPTLLVGDHLLVNKFIFGGRGHWYDRLLPYRDVRRGDIIVFKFPYQNHPHYVKRVIGIPGDRIKIVDQQVYVNGKRLNEPYVVRDPTAPYEPFEDNFPPRGAQYLQSNMQPEWADQILANVYNGEIVVPPGKYFAMGDNRDHSWDSRFWGFVDRDAIMGRPVVIYWSVQGPHEDEADQNLNGWLLSFLDTVLHLPSRTRWSRMFHQVH
ncbi:MAG: signal peptidase I [Acidobacteriia bacterium]|nr:signal peptidase I [Terriglobia bacterium]